MGKRLLSSFAAEDPQRFAGLLENAEDLSESLSILTEIDDGLESGVVARLSPEAANRLLNEVPDALVGTWLDTGPLDAGRLLLARVGQERAARLIEGMSDGSKRRALRRLTGYAAGSIGQLTRIHSGSIKENATVADIKAHVQRYKGAMEGPLAIERHDGTVMGVLDFASFAQSSSKNAIAADFCIPVKPLFADARLPSLSALTRSDEWALLTSMPVVDHKQRLVGYVTRRVLENAADSEKESSLFLDSAIELVKQYWDFMAHMMIVILGRRIRP